MSVLAAAAVVEGAAAAAVVEAVDVVEVVEVVEAVEDFPLPSPSAFWAFFLSGLA